MGKDAANRYLWFRPDSPYIWFRLAVPKKVRDRVGRSIIQFSLDTSDRREARVLAGAKRGDLFREWGLVPDDSTTAVAHLRRVPTEEELEEAAVVLGYELPTIDADTRRLSLRGKGASMYRAHVNFIADELEEQVRATATHDHAAVRELADEAIEVLGWDIAPDSGRYADLCDLLNAARLDGLKHQHWRNTGGISVEPSSPLVSRVRDREAAKAKSGETLLELFEGWAEEMLAKGEKRADTVTQDRKVIKQFAGFVGLDRDVRTITAVDVAAYRDTMRALPPKWASKKVLAGLDMRTAAEKARSLDMPRTAFTNINKHLSTISPLYKWLAKQPAWAGLQNPCNGLFYDKVKGKNPRPPFSSETLNKILSSPLFTGFLQDGEEHQPGQTLADDWRRWIPLVCMFTGARIGEIAQLRLQDVRRECGVWFIRIRHAEKEGLTTKSGKSRDAAVHSMLVTLGFIAFRERRLAAAEGKLDEPLFPELAPNARGQVSGTPSRWWRDYLSAIGVKDPSEQGGDGFGSHSFRHTLSDRLRAEAELLDNQIAVCLGHNQRSTTSGYGKLPQGTVNMLSGWIEAVRFDGVDFSPLVEANRAGPASV